MIGLCAEKFAPKRINKAIKRSNLHNPKMDGERTWTRVSDAIAWFVVALKQETGGYLHGWRCFSWMNHIYLFPPPPESLRFRTFRALWECLWRYLWLYLRLSFVYVLSSTVWPARVQAKWGEPQSRWLPQSLARPADNFGWREMKWLRDPSAALKVEWTLLAWWARLSWK